LSSIGHQNQENSLTEIAMGLLDSVIGALAGGTQGNTAGAGGGQAALISIVLGMLTQRGGGLGAEGGVSGMGGLGDLLARFQQAGLGDAAASWVGTGANQPVSPDQVEGALGSDLLSRIARQIGMPQGETAGQLSELLPQMVDRMTPNGRLPESGFNEDDIAGFEGLDDLLGRFSKP
jgi:uncharacterized protein YidB (DUF937 family)